MKKTVSEQIQEAKKSANKIRKLVERNGESLQKAFLITKDICKDYPEVTNIEIKEDYMGVKRIYVYLDEENPELIKEIYGDSKNLGLLGEALKKIGLETCSGGPSISNSEEYSKAKKAYCEENPQPKSPANDPEWKKLSYYKRNKLWNQFQEVNKEWWAKFRKAEENFPPMKVPGFYFDVEAYGTMASIENFYRGTRYFGD